MSREIKFRAWDKETNKIVYQDRLKSYGEDEYFFVAEGENLTLMRFDKAYDAYIEVEADIMQYTGIKDFKGKEIYEGDIVKRECTCIEYPTQGVVRMIEGRWVIENKKLKYAYPLWSEIDVSYVIGNIYENPNLIEEV